MRIFKLFIAGLLLTSYCFSQPGIENYLIKDVGYISVPTSLEIQSGKYKKFVDEVQKEYGKKFGYEISDNRIIFQQKGLNNLGKDGFSTYARVILETSIGSFGDYENANGKLAITKAELSDLNVQIRTQTEQSFLGTELRIIKRYGVDVVVVNGLAALRISYLRQLKDQPYVTVAIYHFHNNDRLHQLTLSYREQDSQTWRPILAGILNSFKITNIR